MSMADHLAPSFSSSYNPPAERLNATPAQPQRSEPPATRPIKSGSPIRAISERSIIAPPPSSSSAVATGRANSPHSDIALRSNKSIDSLAPPLPHQPQARGHRDIPHSDIALRSNESIDSLAPPRPHQPQARAQPDMYVISSSLPTGQPFGCPVGLFIHLTRVVLTSCTYPPRPTAPKPATSPSDHISHRPPPLPPQPPATQANRNVSGADELHLSASSYSPPACDLAERSYIASATTLPPQPPATQADSKASTAPGRAIDAQAPPPLLFINERPFGRSNKQQRTPATNNWCANFFNFISLPTWQPSGCQVGMPLAIIWLTEAAPTEQGLQLGRPTVF
ncbi:hypothetical protein PGTUg99_006414 [Puccinia graminis f. sp. tritici]|uniref:Uncharacterized protein n=1 Tax=Puccinia graminis f. sp. tritici TaxID=56615 RepID=A0A5B0MGZ8_PUCGR|nr:hypothetical protein PGTUg99_006414 [Puccinia graminis f. sp. tritici]